MRETTSSEAILYGEVIELKGSSHPLMLEAREREEADCMEVEHGFLFGVAKTTML